MSKAISGVMDLTHDEVLCIFHAMNELIPTACKDDQKVIKRVYEKLAQAYAETLPAEEAKQIEDALKRIGKGKVFVKPDEPNPKGKPRIKLH